MFLSKIQPLRKFDKADYRTECQVHDSRLLRKMSKFEILQNFAQNTFPKETVLLPQNTTQVQATEAEQNRTTKKRDLYREGFFESLPFLV